MGVVYQLRPVSHDAFQDVQPKSWDRKPEIDTCFHRFGGPPNKPPAWKSTRISPYNVLLQEHCSRATAVSGQGIHQRPHLTDGEIFSFPVLPRQKSSCREAISQMLDREGGISLFLTSEYARHLFDSRSRSTDQHPPRTLGQDHSFRRMSTMPRSRQPWHSSMIFRIVFASVQFVWP